nr:PREDICTED: uncharacterized protein LOC106704302 [Latimeria chalumnae]|eukprot:XP_014346499.1 PREDICTED: uncharacterized protein LOC106704302 [Latimeria chalumnae]
MEGHYYTNCPHSATNNPPENLITVQECNDLLGEVEVKDSTTGTETTDSREAEREEGETMTEAEGGKAITKTTNQTTGEETSQKPATEGEEMVIELGGENNADVGKGKGDFIVPKRTASTNVKVILTDIKKNTSKTAEDKSRREIARESGNAESWEAEGASVREGSENNGSSLWSDSQEENPVGEINVDICGQEIESVQGGEGSLIPNH